MKKVHFRFQGLQIWKDAIELSDELLDVADRLESIKKFRFAEQLNGSVLSISNNIAEGSGSTSKKDFANFLNYSRRSVFETVNILEVLRRRKLHPEEEVLKHFERLDELSRKILTFSRTLR